MLLRQSKLKTIIELIENFVYGYTIDLHYNFYKITEYINNSGRQTFSENKHIITVLRILFICHSFLYDATKLALQLQKCFALVAGSSEIVTAVEINTNVDFIIAI